jgi:hypothetical protein
VIRIKANSSFHVNDKCEIISNICADYDGFKTASVSSFPLSFDHQLIRTLTFTPTVTDNDPQWREARLQPDHRLVRQRQRQRSANCENHQRFSILGLHDACRQLLPQQQENIDSQHGLDEILGVARPGHG